MRNIILCIVRGINGDGRPIGSLSPSELRSNPSKASSVADVTSRPREGLTKLGAESELYISASLK